MTSWVQSMDPDAVSAGLLIGRLVVGLGLAAHGAQKLFGWFGGHGLGGTAGYFESIGYRPGRPYATLAGLGEFTGGLLVALGALGAVGPALMLTVMIVAVMQKRENGFFATGDGIELPLLYGTAGVALAFIGPGAWSLDAGLGIHGLSTPTVAAIALAIGVLGAVGTLAMRRETPATR